MPAFLAAAALLAPLTGCDRVKAFMSPPAAASAAPAASSHEEKANESKGKEQHAEAGPAGGAEYALPFAWESSGEEPLGRARAFLKDVYVTNGDYAVIAAKQFPTYADKQTPRATVLTCADSRVQTSAFDASPENDDFRDRNIGNQIENGLGSIEYGVEHLETPVLFILGHTGCGAVKAAMDGTGKLERPIQDELAHLHPKKREPRVSEKEAWVNAVVDNVHDQVAVALDKFGKRVHSGKLTVVGAVLDFRNDLGLGAGRVVLVDVNGNRESKRIEAFIQAVTGQKPPERKQDERKSDKRGSTDELLQALAALPPTGSRSVKTPAAAPHETAEHPAEAAHERGD